MKESDQVPKGLKRNELPYTIRELKQTDGVKIDERTAALTLVCFGRAKETSVLVTMNS